MKKHAAYLITYTGNAWRQIDKTTDKIYRRRWLVKFYSSERTPQIRNQILFYEQGKDGGQAWGLPINWIIICGGSH